MSRSVHSTVLELPSRAVTRALSGAATRAMHQKQEPVSAQTLVKAKMASVRSSWIKGAFIDRLVFARVVWRMDTSFTSPLLSLLTQLSIPCITHFGVGFSPPIVLLKARKKSQFQGTFFKKYAQRFQNPQSL